MLNFPRGLTRGCIVKVDQFVLRTHILENTDLIISTVFGPFPHFHTQSSIYFKFCTVFRIIDIRYFRSLWKNDVRVRSTDNIEQNSPYSRISALGSLQVVHVYPPPEPMAPI